MKGNLAVFLFSILVVALLGIPAVAQVDTQNPFGRPRRDEPLPQNIRETLKKHEIEQIKKDYEDLLAKGEEAVKLTEEVRLSFQKNKKLSSADLEKLEQLEKLLKKIRKELGGDDDDEELKTNDKPSTISSALASLKESATGLFDELKRTSRYSISVVAIQSSNSLIDIVRYIRFWKK